MLVTGLASLAGYALFDTASDEAVAFVLAFAGGAVLTMLADTMMPEAFEHGGKLVGLATTLASPSPSRSPPSNEPSIDSPFPDKRRRNARSGLPVPRHPVDDADLLRLDHWFWLLITVFADIFRRHDIGGGKKTLWIIFAILTPFLGVFIYLISQGKSMAERNAKRWRPHRRSKTTTSSPSQAGGGAADEIDKAKKLLDSGAITQAEFDAIKAKALAT